jgi:hypothetical protein
MTVPRFSVLIAAAVVSSALAAPAGVARTIDLRTQPSFEIVGARPIDFAGEAVAAGGDVNGDHIDDVLVAAPSADAPRRKNAGAVYVVFGRRRAARAVKAHPSARIALDGPAQGFRILGAGPGAGAGASVAGAGDVDGDGLDDVVVGVPGGGPTVASPMPGLDVTVHAGAAYLVFGRRAGTTVDLAHLGDAGVKIDGAIVGRNQLGMAVAGGRDVDGDGRPDIVVTDMPSLPLRPAPPVVPAPASSAHVISGASLHRGEELRIDGPGVAGSRMDGNNLGPVSLAADMNGDGRAEVVVSDGSGLHEQARVVFGRPAGSAPLDLAQLGDSGFSLVDSRQPIQGIQVNGGGDVNGDGRGDLVASSYVRLAHHRYAGVAAVIFGAPSADPVWINRPGPRLLEAIGPSVAMIKPPPGTPGPGRAPDMIGPTPVQAVAIVGDTDGDGLDDLLAGGFASPHGRLAAGSAFLFHGRRTSGRIRLSGSGNLGPSGRVVRIDGAYAGDTFGSAAAPAGDFNGDRQPDVLVAGASSTRNGRLRAGAAWVLTDIRP